MPYVKTDHNRSCNLELQDMIYWLRFSPACVKYLGGGGGYHEYLGGYLEYRGGCSVPCGGHHEYRTLILKLSLCFQHNNTKESYESNGTVCTGP